MIKVHTLSSPDTHRLRCNVDTQDLIRAFEGHRDRAYAVALHITGDAEEAADLLQEAFLRAKKTLGSFRGDSALHTWLMRIVVNLSLKHVRRQEIRRRLRYLVPSPPRPPSAEWLVGSSERTQRLAAALQRLPARQRAAFVLRHVHDLSTNQVAQVMSVSVPTVKTHLLRATERLRREMKERD